MVNVSPSPMKTINDKVTRYRVTLDFTVDATHCVSPNEWNWKKLLELKGNENVNEVYVENLGDYTLRKNK
jgi:hypothetical protein